MATRPADPLAETTWLLVDGNNLLHRLSSAKAGAPRSALIGRLRGIIPLDIAIDVVFDGPPEHGLRGERIAGGLKVRYGGGRTADALLVSLVDEVHAADGPVGTAGVLVVTDDAALRRSLVNRGARTAGTAWLLGRLDRGTDRARPASPRSMKVNRSDRANQPNPSNPDRPAPPFPMRSGLDIAPMDAEDGDADDRPGWRSGRGATTKRGNPRRSPRHRPGS
jgi:predicted RNA-binding protein with PIN domain